LQKISKNKLKYFRSFLQKKVRKKNKKFIAEGEKCVEEVLKSSFEITDTLYLQGSGKKFLHLIESAKKRNINVLTGSKKELKECSDSITPQGIIALIKEKKYDYNILFDKRINLLLLLDSISDPGNLGTIIRTADWFGVQGILLGGNSVELYNPKVVRSTMGSIFHIPIFENINLKEEIGKLKNAGFRIYAADVRGEKKLNFRSKKIALLLGNETRGVSPELLKITNYKIAIPGDGRCESLNVAVSGGILLWEIFHI